MMGWRSIPSTPAESEQGHDTEDDYGCNHNRSDADEVETVCRCRIDGLLSRVERAAGNKRSCRKHTVDDREHNDDQDDRTDPEHDTVHDGGVVTCRSNHETFHLAYSPISADDDKSLYCLCINHILLYKIVSVQRFYVLFVVCICIK